MAGGELSPFFLEVRLNDSSAAAGIDDLIAKIEKLGSRVDRLSGKSDKAARGMGGLKRQVNSNNQAMLEASRGVEDFFIVFSQQGATIQSFSNAMRGASNNISQMIFLMGGAKVAMLASGVAIAAVLIPILIGWIAKMWGANEVIKAVEDSLRDFIDEFTTLQSLPPLKINIDTGDALTDKLAAFKRGMEDLRKEASAVTAQFQVLAEEESQARRDRETAKTVIGQRSANKRIIEAQEKMHELNQKLVSLHGTRVKNAEELLGLEKQLAKQKELQTIRSDRTLLRELFDQSREQGIPVPVGRQLNKRFGAELVAEESTRSRAIEVQEGVRNRAFGRAGVQTPEQIEEKKEREQEAAHKKKEADRISAVNRKEDERQEKVRVRLDRQILVGEASEGGSRSGALKFGEELKKFADKADEVFTRDEADSRIEAFAEIQRAKIDEATRDKSAAASPEISGLVERQRKIQLDVLKVETPAEKNANVNWATGHKWLEKIVENLENRPGGAVL